MTRERLHDHVLSEHFERNRQMALISGPRQVGKTTTCRGARAETLVACHLLKAVEGWTDLGLGEFELLYVRDKLKREVDFLVVNDGKPWLLVEVKTAETKLSNALGHFQMKTKAAHAFQVVMDLPFVQADCFRHKEPIVVPARTFLAQLL